nr:MAG TPA: hypothetical protein [Caudoviricetes sp.]
MRVLNHTSEDVTHAETVVRIVRKWRRSRRFKHGW